MKIKILILLTLTTFLVSNSLFAFNKNYLVKIRPEVAKSDIFAIFNQYQTKILKEFNKLNLYLIEIPSNPVLDLIKKNLAKTFFIYLEEDFTLKAFVTPNDTLFNQQTELSRIDIAKSWDITTGSNDNIVAVVDTGINFNHPDLKDQIYVNEKEIPGNGIDDDHNGYIDDVNGWNFNDENNNPNDLNGHGSHVSGTIGASSNNQLGISGLNWDVRIMPLQFLDKNGSGSTSNAISAIIYAADNSAKIINASWGGGQFSQSLLDAINYAYQKGVLFVAAAGNESNNSDKVLSYPADYDSPALLSIASTDDVNKLSSFSNYGATQVDLAAPGGKILSTVLGDKYERYSGTSMASPMVSGIAALVLAKNPNLSVLQLKNSLLNAVKPSDAFKGLLSTEGEINSLMALTQLEDNSLQIWPKKINLKAGTSFYFSAYGGNPPYSYSIDNTNIGSIDNEGKLTTISNQEGILTVKIKDNFGEEVSSNQINIILDKSGSGGGGCVKSAYAGNEYNNSSNLFWEFISYFALFILYFGFRVSRRFVFIKK